MTQCWRSGSKIVYSFQLGIQRLEDIVEKRSIDMTSQELQESYRALMGNSNSVASPFSPPVMVEGVFKRVSILEDTPIHYAFSTST